MFQEGANFYQVGKKDVLKPISYNWQIIISILYKSPLYSFYKSIRWLLMYSWLFHVSVPACIYLLFFSKFGVRTRESESCFISPPVYKHINIMCYTRQRISS